MENKEEWFDTTTEKKKSLFGITSEYQNLMIQIIESEGELTEEIQNALAINEKDLTLKSTGYIAVMNKENSEIDFIDNEIKRLQAIKKAKTKLVARLKESILIAMNLYEITEIKTGLNTIKTRTSESVEVTDIEKLPSSVITIKKSAVKSEIKKLLKIGSVAGAELIKKTTLNIK